MTAKRPSAELSHCRFRKPVQTFFATPHGLAQMSEIRSAVRVCG